MSDKIQFSISRVRLSAVAFCLGLGGVLLFSAGIVTGLMVGPAAPKVSASARSVIPAQAKELIKPPAPQASTMSAPAVPAPVSPAKAESSSTVPSTKAPATDKISESTSDEAARPGELIVQVASFLDHDRAQRFASSLKRQGFGQATVGHFEVAKQTWYVVRLGPYRDWDIASQVAAEVGRSYDLQCSVRPL